MSEPAADEYYLGDVPLKDLVDEIQTRLEHAEQHEERVNKKIEKFREILEASARIAFGDFTDLPRLKLLFNDAGVSSTASGQIEMLLDSE